MLSDLKQSLVRAFAAVNVIHDDLGNDIYKCKYEKSSSAESKGKQ
jgi:hypothetical protein